MPTTSAGSQRSARSVAAASTKPAQDTPIRAVSSGSNLVSAGYTKSQDGHLFLKPATPPSYLHCANAPTCTTIEYKSGTRAHIASEGYTIMADFGDQYSDLLGGNAGHQVKIPNPMYYIP